MAPADWSSLPSDLVNRVADCFLATNDLDYYMDFRAVCSNWRYATADPKSSPFDPRFRPRRWVMLEEVSKSLFLNVATGRFLRKSLPLLRGGRYHFVTTTPGGSVVLADKEPPHAARVLNPFTGSLIRFAAPVPCDLSFAAAVVGSCVDSFTLVLASDSARKVYWADLGSEAFLFQVKAKERPPSGMLPLIARKYIGRKDPGADEVHFYDQVRPCRMESRVLAADAGGEDGEEVFVFTFEKSTHRIGLFKTKKIITEAAGGEENQLELVTSIGNHALFVGDRCLMVDADKLPSVEPNCIYYEAVESPAGSLNIYVYDLNHGRADRIAASSIFNPAVFRDEDHPFSLVELLVNYTTSLPQYELIWERIQALKIDAARLLPCGYSAIDDFPFF